MGSRSPTSCAELGQVEDPRPSREREPQTLPRGHKLADGKVILHEASTACPCSTFTRVSDEVYGPGWWEGIG